MSGMELVEFLRARLDEDEAVAREAGGEHWHYPSHESSREHMLSDSGEIVMYRDSLRDDMGLHIARHDPAHVLADVEAKRRIVELHEENAHRECRLCGHLDGDYPCTTLRLHALSFAGHPDYRPEWRPS